MAPVDEWVDKAEADYQAALALPRRRKFPLPDIVCYHCEQSAEKYLKAYLVFQGAVPPPIHDLVRLLNLCAPDDATLAGLSPETLTLTPYGVLVRYPGMATSAADAKDGLAASRRVRRMIRQRLGL